MIEIMDALKAYKEKFGDIAYLTNPALMANKEMPQFIMDLVQTGTKATKQIVEEKFGPVSWNW